MGGNHRRGAATDPVDRDAYVGAGLPWFDYYDADAQDLAPSQILAKVKTVGEKLGGEDTSFVPIDPKTVITLGDPAQRRSQTDTGDSLALDVANAATAIP